MSSHGSSSSIYATSMEPKVSMTVILKPIRDTLNQSPHKKVENQKSSPPRLEQTISNTKVWIATFWLFPCFVFVVSFIVTYGTIWLYVTVTALIWNWAQTKDLWLKSSFFLNNVFQVTNYRFRPDWLDHTENHILDIFRRVLY